MPAEREPTPRRRIKVSGEPPRGLSKAERIGKRYGDPSGREVAYPKRRADERHESLLEAPLTDSMYEMYKNNIDHRVEALEAVPGLQMRARRGLTKPSSTRKKLVKEGNRKFIGPRQLSSEMAEDYESARGPEVLAKDLVRGRKKLRGGEDESQGISSEKLKALLQFLLKDKARIEAKFDHPGWDDVGQTFNI